MMSFTRNISCWLRQQQQQRPNVYVNQSATLSRELDKEKYEQKCVSPVSEQMTVTSIFGRGKHDYRHWELNSHYLSLLSESRDSS